MFDFLDRFRQWVYLRKTIIVHAAWFWQLDFTELWTAKIEVSIKKDNFVYLPVSQGMGSWCNYKPEVDVNFGANPVQPLLLIYCPLRLSMGRHLKNLYVAKTLKNQTDLDERCISLVVQNLDPGNGAKLLKSVEEGIRVGQVGRDVGHQEYNLSNQSANQQPHKGEICWNLNF